MFTDSTGRKEEIQTLINKAGEGLEVSGERKLWPSESRHKIDNNRIMNNKLDGTVF